MCIYLQLSQMRELDHYLFQDYLVKSFFLALSNPLDSIPLYPAMYRNLKPYLRSRLFCLASGTQEGK